ncbi:hypothetical protein P9112_006559 [Eukaryota sp. TZLM1-RC]
MPLADSDSDTDWNAQAKILPVGTSSSPSLNHSPHNTSYARNFFRKNFNSKTDHCTRKNTQKPPLRYLRSFTRSMNDSVSRNLFSPAKIGKSLKSTTDNNYGLNNRIHHGSHVVFRSSIQTKELVAEYSQEQKEKIVALNIGLQSKSVKGSKKCSICGISGHNSRTCPEKQKREIELKSAQQILECSVPADAVVKGAENNVSDDQHLNVSSAHSSSPSEHNNFCCPFCKKDVTDSRNGRKLLFCTNCKAADTIRPPIQIPQSLFSSTLADANSDTLEKLQKLHPQENFKCSKPEVYPFWIENPITAIEVFNAIQKLPKGKAAGPSGISLDLLKIACSSAPEIADDLAHYYQQLIVLKINPPFELLAARLLALVKPGNGIKPDGIRPIAVGESLSRLLASIVFDRVKDKASAFLNPHQFGIKTIDGASVAAIASDTFFNAEENNFIFNLDFKNAFNSVKREAIFEVIKSDFPELSNLIYNSFGLKSSSGLKQGDPLGPLLFCLAIHKTLNIIKQKYPSIKIVAYMDDISLIGSFNLLELVAQEIADSYENIGLYLNASKCLLIGSSVQDLVINDSIVPFTNYSSDAFKFLGCW